MNVSEDETLWVVTEFAEAELGDARRMRRLVELATALAHAVCTALIRSPDRCDVLVDHEMDGAVTLAAL